MPQNRYMPYIEQGERDFSFAFVVGTREDVLDKAPRLSAHFNRRPMVLSFYPTGVGEKPQTPVLLRDNDIVTIEAFKKADCGDGYILRLFNPTEKKQTAVVQVYDAEETVEFGKFEIKTLRYEAGKLREVVLMEGILKE